MEEWKPLPRDSRETAAESGAAATDRTSRSLRRIGEILLGAEIVHRPALARMSGLSRQQVSELMAELEVRGLVHVEGHYDGVPGRSPLGYRLVAGAATAMATTRTPDGWAGVLIDLRGDVLASYSESGGRDRRQWPKALSNLAAMLCRRAMRPRYRLRHVVIGLGDDEDGAAITEDGQFATRLQAELGTRVRVLHNLPPVSNASADIEAGLRQLAALACEELVAGVFDLTLRP